jgi:hypothetical protein
MKSLSPTRGGIVLEASGRNPTEWVYNSPEAGAAILEVRYALAEGRFPSALTINGQAASTIVLWSTSGDTVFAWDRVPVRLGKGKNTIRLETRAPARIDGVKLFQ